MGATWLHHRPEQSGQQQAIFTGQKLVVVGGSSGMGRDTAADVVAGGGSAVVARARTSRGGARARSITSTENRRFLQSGGGAYIIGEKLRSGSAEAKAALSRQGHYKTVTGNLQVKEVRLPEAGDRFVICFNPDQASATPSSAPRPFRSVTKGIDANEQPRE